MTHNITVVIPCHNMAHTLSRAMYSAINAGANEVVVVNDASEDNPKREFDTVRFLCKSRGVKLQYLETGSVRAGVCHARNKAIDAATYELIVPLDADDVLLEDGLSHLRLAHIPGAFVYGDWLEGDEVRLAKPPEKIYTTNLTYATWLFAKSDWKAVGGFAPEFNVGGEEWAFMIALIEHGITPIKVNHTIYRRSMLLNVKTTMARSQKTCLKALLDAQRLCTTSLLYNAYDTFLNAKYGEVETA